MGSSSQQRSVIRWLLRVLGEAAFLRLFVDEGTAQYPFRIFEQAFWSLGADVEHPTEAQKEAWLVLKGEEGRMGDRPVDWFMGIVGLLRDRAQPGSNFERDLRELSRYWSLPELFFPPVASVNVDGYHEIHCHFRGAVPFETLWAGWTSNERWRASLRTETVQAGPWKRTWAELVKQAAEPFVRWRHAPTARVDRRWFRLASRALQPTRVREAVVPYLAVGAGLRRAMLYQRTEGGLALFVKRFKKFSDSQKAGPAQAAQHTEDLVIAVMRRFEAEGAVALELRPTLERTRIELQKKLLQVVRGYVRYVQTSRRPVKLGLVPSLFKQDGVERQRGEPAIERWKHQAETWRAQVAALLEVLRTVPALRYFVVGLDAAGKERGCPARAFAPAIGMLHDFHRASGVWNAWPGRQTRSSDMTAGRTLAELNAIDWEPIRLGLTMHAGEDFLDPLTGLRQIAETIDVLDLRRHDRLGHALAMSLAKEAVQKMLDRRKGNGEVEAIGSGIDRFRLLKPRGEHLLDLAWALTATTQESTRRLVSAQLSHAATSTFGAPADPDRLAAALRAAPHVEAWLPAVRYNEPRAIRAEDRVATVVDDTWHSIFEGLRRQLLDRVARMGIVVESCPTSNCAVANLETAPIAAFLTELDLRVTVATDDPALFGAWPSNEMARDEVRPYQKRLLDANARASFIR